MLLLAILQHCLILFNIACLRLPDSEEAMLNLFILRSVKTTFVFLLQALGMKLVVRTNNMGRMKAVFTAEIFTESTVAAHAVKEYYQQQLFLCIPISA